MNARLLAACAATTLLVCSCSTPKPRARPGGIQASDFEATIARIRGTYPASPALLNAQLAYGDYLLSAAPGPCARRIVLAQEQLGSIDASRQARVMFPDGWPQAADLEYRLHLARAACGSKADSRDDMLAAVAAARRAADLYRNEFDYQSMVIMQFDAAVALHELGENAAGLKALETALDMDREYGLRDDALQNYKLLLTWRGEPSGAAQVAELMQDFPKRQAVLNFGWHASNAQITFDSRRVNLEQGQVVHGHAAAVFERRIDADHGGGWNVSYAHRLDQYEPGVWPSNHSATARRLIFSPAVFPAVGYKVSAKGEFEGVMDAKAFADRLIAKTEGMIKAGAVPSKDSHDATSDALESVADALAPGMLEAATAENYQLETAMWIGARLDQGVWYQISAPLSLPALSQFLVQQHLEFAFTRRVPCTAGAAAQTCAEIVIRATSDKTSLHDLLVDLTGSNTGAQSVEYDASIVIRIVVNPATLLAYTREDQIYWYASLGPGPGGAVLSSEHIVSRTTYGADQPRGSMK